MHRRAVIKLLGSSAIGGSTILSGCARLNTSGSSTTVRMGTKGHQSFFDPVGLLVDPGETVTFEMESGNHSATAYHEQYSLAKETRLPKGVEPFDSGVLIDRGDTFEHTFDTKGTYDYYCIPHKTMGMIARIVVGEPGGPAEGSMPPDGKVPTSQRIIDNGSVGYEQFDTK
ncbi:plastocyanin/azurin family copper-binding protein [Haladaptatus caseinilyticus]|uniref:plastocyanin/azurin family copper-binding protein n=1 Tax=Haladaptatus caseinilyticus TaxID=2993314 RepID=UPI00224B5874|nr:plastocyanin/azurin family copper-binding protein [Haladaptatus caseinilyticus]